MLPKEIKQLIDRESLNERKEAGGNFDYMDGFEDGYTVGATALAEKMAGFVQWVGKMQFSCSPSGDYWYYSDGEGIGSPAELLVYYINQIKK